MGVSLLCGTLIRMFLPVPRNFKYGIIAAAGWSNSGDLPTSVVATITLSAPFNGIADSDRSVAYVASKFVSSCPLLWASFFSLLISVHSLHSSLLHNDVSMSRNKTHIS